MMTTTINKKRGSCEKSIVKQSLINGEKQKY